MRPDNRWSRFKVGITTSRTQREGLVVLLVLLTNIAVRYDKVSSTLMTLPRRSTPCQH